jgi:Ca2+/Na+ antiporter
MDDHTPLLVEYCLNIDRSFAVLTVAVNLYLLVIHRNSLEGVNVLAFLLAVASFVCYANQYRNYARYHLAWHITSEIGTLVLVAHLFE